jgi:hypothetical protein
MPITLTPRARDWIDESKASIPIEGAEAMLVLIGSGPHAINIIFAAPMPGYERTLHVVDGVKIYVLLTESDLDLQRQTLVDVIDNKVRITQG